MIGANGFALPPAYLAHLNQLFPIGDWLAAQGWAFHEPMEHFDGARQIGFLALLLAWTWLLPNTYQLMGQYSPALDISAVIPKRKELIRIHWIPSKGYALLAIVMIIIIINKLDTTSEFLYFQF